MEEAHRTKTGFFSTIWGRLLLAALGGCAVFFAFPRWDWAPLAWVALVPNLIAARGLGGKRSFYLGWFSGTVTNLGGFYWVTGLLMDFGHMSAIAAAPLCLLLAIYQGLVFGVWLLLLRWLERRVTLGAWLLVPVSYIAAEYLVPFIFPWFYANSQHWVLPFVQVCELGGVSLLGFWIAMTNGALYDAWIFWREGQGRVALRRLILAAAIPALLAGYGLIRMAMVDARMEQAPKLKVGMVEADVGIWEKEDPQKIDDNLVLHQRLSRELEKAGAQLIVWPETAYQASQVFARRAGRDRVERFRVFPRDVAEIPPAASLPPEHAAEDDRNKTPAQERVAPQRGFKTPLLFGALTWKENPDNRAVRHRGLDLFNTALLLDSEGKVLGAYDKVYLLMFGEYVPFSETFPTFYEWFPEAGDLTPGRSVEVLPFGPWRLGVMVCYEDIIPAFSRKVADKAPHLLVNITNDAWFGKTSEPALHLALAIFRTVENRLALVRSTNTGISAFVDANGRVLQHTSIHGAETLLADMPLLESRTPYQALGDWPAWGCIGAFPVLLVRDLWRRRRRAAHS